MATHSRSVSKAATELEASASLSRRRSNPAETRGAVGNDGVEAALKEICAQLRSNKKHVKKLRREVQNNKKHLKKLRREVEINRDEIKKCKKRMDAMAYNNMARTINQGNREDESELLSLRNRQNKYIGGYPDAALDFEVMTEEECDRIARELDFPFFQYTEGYDKPRNLLQAMGWGGDPLDLQQKWDSWRASTSSSKR